jgi:hypothetical protein
MTDTPDQNSKNTIGLIDGARGVLIQCMDSMGTMSLNSHLEGGDASDWAVKFSLIRQKLDDCENILDDLNETHMPMNPNQAL